MGIVCMGGGGGGGGGGGVVGGVVGGSIQLVSLTWRIKGILGEST